MTCFEPTSVEINKISAKNFGKMMGQNTLKPFKIKDFSVLLIGFESRTGHQKNGIYAKNGCINAVFLYKCIKFCSNFRFILRFGAEIWTVKRL